MKKKILISAIVLSLTVFLLIFFIKYQKVSKYNKSISELPNIDFSNYTLTGDSPNLKGNINCFIMFNSECGFCMDEIEDIVDSIDEFSDVNFLLISNESKESLIEYSEDSEFYGLANFTILRDKDQMFNNFFKYETIPSTYTYSKDGILMNYKSGFVPIHLLKEMMYKN